MSPRLAARALVLTGDGINCEVETADALRLAGFKTDIRHLNDVIAENFPLDALSEYYSLLALPGGFSFGDDLASGRVLALKIQHGLKWNLATFSERGGLVIGICNGFQALIRMGVFGKDLTISQNEQGKFVDQWTRVTPQGNKCVWLKGVGTIDLPIRHGEGRIVLSSATKIETLNRFERHGQICLKYETNPNGSEERIAGLSDITGRIFGLMPHPEAFVRWTAHPDWTAYPDRASSPGQGLMVFENAYKAARDSN
ncbi:MAG: phosphoribosylformylglycinamidine synthase subunit PurQ [Xanthomonadaceae bacterium]|nr:phosphoribosylformylglycinamidine synthase subunit PurQ [Xanthomonadaceae bacterium]